MHEINIETIQFYATCWAVAFAASFARSGREINRTTYWNVISRCCLSGFLAFGVVGILADSQRDFGDSATHGRWFFICASAVIGVAIRDPEKIFPTLLARFVTFFKPEDIQSNSIADEHKDDGDEGKA